MDIFFLTELRTTPLTSDDMTRYYPYAKDAARYENYPTSVPLGSRSKHRIISGTGDSLAFYSVAEFKTPVYYLRKPLIRGRKPFTSSSGSPLQFLNVGRLVELSTTGGAATVEFTLAPLNNVIDDTALWHESTMSNITGKSFSILEHPSGCIRIVAAESVSWTIAFQETLR